MTNMIERVARAFWGDEYDGSEYQLRGARVAIAAMQEPTDAMLEAGNQTLRAFSCWCCWQAMIYAALRESNER